MLPTLHPIKIKNLIGNINAFNTVLEVLNGTIKHHAVCISGPRGIGKASTVYSAIKQSAGANATKNIENKAHPDILIIEAEDEDTSELSTIPVEDVRKIGAFANMHPSALPYKCIIIDPIDCMSMSSANAILKILEEPPKNTYFFLICNNKGSILQTILSRCLSVKCTPSNNQEFTQICKELDIKPFAKTLSNNKIRTAIEISSSEREESYTTLLEDILDGTNRSINMFSSTNILTHFVVRIVHNISKALISDFQQDITEIEKEFVRQYINKFYPTPLEMANKLQTMLTTFKRANEFFADKIQLVNFVIKTLSC